MSSKAWVLFPAPEQAPIPRPQPSLIPGRMDRGDQGAQACPNLTHEGEQDFCLVTGLPYPGLAAPLLSGSPPGQDTVLA